MEKRRVPPLKKKRRRLEELDPESLSYALHFNELVQAEEQAEEQAATEKKAIIAR